MTDRDGEPRFRAPRSNQNALRLTIGALVVALIVLSSVVFALPEGHVAVVTRFGRPLAVAKDAGAHFKLPWPFERAHILDARKQLWDTRFVETLTRDQKNIVLRTYVVWSIADGQRFLEAVGTRVGAEEHLDSLVTNAKNALLGRYPLSALVSTKTEDLKLDEIERALTRDAQVAAKRYGIAVHQVGLKRLGLPEENLRAVFEQMRQERAKEAARFRAVGARKALEIRAAADLKVAKIRAKAQEEAETINGKTEAAVATIYADAHRKDPSFYRFTRSLEALKVVLGEKSTVILRADRAPFDLLTSVKGSTQGSTKRGALRR
ncbi:MAG: protease modulator HflC [Deltaproteobacteria bacterium]|nr:protease modulator HflC [Deltaproteobacteria bacterium]